MAGANLLEQVRASGVLPPEQLGELAGLPEAANPDPRVLGRVLWERGYLSRYQVNLIAAGRGKELRVGPYLLLDRLGEGGMGMIFKARHLQFNLLVALKLVRKEKLGSPDSVKRFGREMAAIGTLNHPNIVRALDFGQFDGTPYIAMEYVDGTDLSRLVKQNGPLPVAVACEYLRQGAIGLAEAHAHGIIHRDVKPSNLLVTAAEGSAPVVKLLDLGLARLGDPSESGLQLTRIGQVLGTPDYLSPEQARDARHVDARADVYGLGCTLFYVLTGRPPFQANSLPDLLIKHQSEPPPPLRRLCRSAPPALEALLNRLLAKKPEQRAQTAAEVAAALEPFTRDPEAKPVVIQRVPPPPLADDLWEPQKNGRVRPAGGRQRRLWVAAAVGGAIPVLLIGLAALLWPRGTVPPDDAGGKKPPAKGKEKPGPNPPQAKTDADKGKGKAKPPIPPPPRGTFKEDRGHLVSADGHPRGTLVRAVAVAPNEKLVASGDENGNVLIWDVVGRKLLYQVQARGRVRSLLFADDKQLLAGAEGGVTAWDLTDGSPAARPPRRGTFLAPDLSALSFDSPSAVLQLWHPDGKARGEVAAFKAAAVEVAYRRDSQRALVLGGRTLLIVDLAEADARLRAPFPSVGEHPTAGCWGRTDRELILGGNDGVVRVTDVDAPRDGIAVGEKQREAILCVALSPDGKHVLAGGGAGPLHHINLGTGKVAAFAGHANKVRAVAYFPGGKRAVSADNDGVVRVWDLGKAAAAAAPPERDGDRKATRFDDSRGVTCLALSDDGKELLSGAGDGTVRLWDVTTGTERKRYSVRQLGAVRAVRFSPAGDQVLAFGEGQEGHLWSKADGKPTGAFGPREWKVSGRATGIAFLDKGKRLVAAYDGALALWHKPGERPLAFTAAERFTGLARLGDGGHFACGDAAGFVHVYRIYTLFDRSRGVLRHELEARGKYRAHDRPVVCLAYSAKRRQLLTGGEDGTVVSRSLDDMLVGVVRLAPPTTVARLPSRVTALAFANADGTRFVCGCADGSLQLWPYDARMPIAAVRGTGEVRDLVAVDGGRRVVYAADSIREWMPPAE